MHDNREHRIRNFFQRSYHTLSNFEHAAIEKILHRSKQAADTESDKEKLTFGQRMADGVASFGGSWTFILLFAAFLIAWVVLNSIMLPMMLADKEGFDPYPYILLNLFLSMLAAIQAPIIMMSQNRQAINDRMSAAEDFEVNLKSEMEILSLHEKVDELRIDKWEELLEIQQQQIHMLTTMFQKHLEEEHGQGHEE
ncbi:MAG: DUF1003 domain-containing protein [Phycisphaerales bacterium]|nr:DUF1003 domain-containing protein [Phycisphaerales bacterium]